MFKTSPSMPDDVAPLVYVNKLKSLVARESYHIIAVMRIHMNRMARRLEGNVGTYTGGRSVTA
jgi:hypothetical protein